MNFALILSLLIVTENVSKIETIKIDGFKSESTCQSEIAKIRVTKLKYSNVDILFSHCTMVR